MFGMSTSINILKALISYSVTTRTLSNQLVARELIRHSIVRNCVCINKINADALKKWNEKLHHSSVVVQHMPGSSHLTNML